MFETPEIRTSYIDIIVSWIKSNYDIDDDQLQSIGISLSMLTDDKLIEAGKEIESFNVNSQESIARLSRQIRSVEFSLKESIERSSVNLPIFS